MRHSKSNPETSPNDSYRAQIKALGEAWGTDEIELPSDDDLTELKQIHEQQGKDDFDVYLDDVTTEFLEKNSPEFKENIKIVTSSRSPEAQEAARARQLVLYEQAKLLITNLAGLPAEASMDDFELSRNTIVTILQEAKETQGGEFDPLKALGIITMDQNEQEVFTFPSGLFPPSTERKWAAYLQAVREHIIASNHNRIGIESRNNLQEADQRRRTAHDAVSSDLKNLLNLPWDKEDIRELVSKMRDNRFPNLQTGEKERTNMALQLGMTVTKALHNHLLPHFDDLPDPELQVFPRPPRLH